MYFSLDKIIHREGIVNKSYILHRVILSPGPVTSLFSNHTNRIDICRSMQLASKSLHRYNIEQIHSRQTNGFEYIGRICRRIIGLYSLFIIKVLLNLDGR
jgi:hypothetical protein